MTLTRVGDIAYRRALRRRSGVPHDRVQSTTKTGVRMRVGEKRWTHAMPKEAPDPAKHRPVDGCERAAEESPLSLYAKSTVKYVRLWDAREHAPCSKGSWDPSAEGT